jgi:hypothetical protein
MTWTPIAHNRMLRASTVYSASEHLLAARSSDHFAIAEWTSRGVVDEDRVRARELSRPLWSATFRSICCSWPSPGMGM